MDVLMLSRLQFATATLFHFLFVPLTLGLSVLIALMETQFVRTGDAAYRRMARFWGQLFLINFAIGVVTGITLEFQFGTNWSRYSTYVGDVFGALLAIEATVTFFMESTFIAVWALGWKKLSPQLHVMAIWLVALASNLSAYWILTANAWMQHPVGYALRNGRAEVTDFLAVITQPFAVVTFVHTVSGAYVLAGFFVLAISAWHLLRGHETAFFSKSFHLAANFTLVAALVVMGLGHLSGSEVAAAQPAKLAAMESHWETTRSAPMYLLQWPDAKQERNAIQALPVPGALSMLAFHDPQAEVQGLKAFPASERPPVFLTWISFKIMLASGGLIMLTAMLAWYIRRNPAAAKPILLQAILLALPLPWIAIESGWILAEVGRQPWIVYGVMKTSDAVSRLSTGQVATSLVGFVTVYSLLGFAAVSLLVRFARKGPVAE
jgi:cytochrome d ubiquinol oxidase subunit I